MKYDMPVKVLILFKDGTVALASVIMFQDNINEPYITMKVIMTSGPINPKEFNKNKLSFT